MSVKDRNLCRNGREMPGPAGSECAPEKCRRCGFNPEEARRRKSMIEAGMLTPNKDGLLRLVIRK